jgi:hypothetical protein
MFFILLFFRIKAIGRARLNIVIWKGQKKISLMWRLEKEVKNENKIIVGIDKTNVSENKNESSGGTGL